jgi:hypothetical protein
VVVPPPSPISPPVWKPPPQPEPVVAAPPPQAPIPEPVKIPPPPVEPQVRSLPVVLMATVGKGFSAVIIILVLLIIGLWYFTNRVITQLTTREPRNA